MSRLDRLKKRKLYAGNGTILEELDLSCCIELKRTVFTGLTLKRLILSNPGGSYDCSMDAEKLEAVDKEEE